MGVKWCGTGQREGLQQYYGLLWRTYRMFGSYVLPFKYGRPNEDEQSYGSLPFAAAADADMPRLLWLSTESEVETTTSDMVARKSRKLPVCTLRGTTTRNCTHLTRRGAKVCYRTIQYELKILTWPSRYLRNEQTSFHKWLDTSLHVTHIVVSSARLPSVVDVSRYVSTM